MPELFKSQADKEAYFTLYEEVLSLWPLKPEAMKVETSFGATHLHAVGPPEAAPLLLLPGFGNNSTMWYANLGALAKNNRVYAVDAIGQPGRSIAARTLRADNCHQWLRELIDHLGQERVNLMGVSLGGWMALDLALQCPERAGKVILQDPAATLQKLSAGFFWHSLMPIS